MRVVARIGKPVKVFPVIRAIYPDYRFAGSVPDISIMAKSTSENEPNAAVQLRIDRDLTQRVVAAALDIRQATLSDWERNVTPIKVTPSQMIKLLALYDCELIDLVRAFEPDQLNEVQEFLNKRTR